MQEQRRGPGGDIEGPAHGDYSDWDNPEDDEDAPEGYYDDEGDDDDSYVPGPDDPDYDLSEEARYAGYDSRQRSTIMPRWVRSSSRAASNCVSSSAYGLVMPSSGWVAIR